MNSPFSCVSCVNRGRIVRLVPLSSADCELYRSKTWSIAVVGKCLFVCLVWSSLMYEGVIIVAE